MKDPAAATIGLRRLSDLGVRLAVDDFGTGYSSLAYLQQFPIDLLKIDGSFVSDILTRSGSLLVRAIVQIAHTLGLVPVAEGVESAAQAEALAACGCDLAQGFHLGRPARRATRPGSSSRRPGSRRRPRRRPAGPRGSRGRRGQSIAARGVRRGSTSSFGTRFWSQLVDPTRPDAAGRRARVLGRAPPRPDRVDPDLARCAACSWSPS